MVEYEDQCVDCGLPCFGPSCKYKNVPVFRCDQCGDYAGYRYEQEDYCEDCFKRLLKDTFDELTVMEKAEALNIDCEDLRF